MSNDSRLEKFLYAICTLDLDDLPTPLSRIEVLYNCFITGETPPVYEPLSRAEKYLLCILGSYKADNLPNPLSRAEVLLYKLAIGDSNLDDVEVAKSRYELLLMNIIENGGLLDISHVEYVLSSSYSTLYNTLECVIKSAILKGDTQWYDAVTGTYYDVYPEDTTDMELELVSVKMPVLTTSNCPCVFGKGGRL